MIAGFAKTGPATQLPVTLDEFRLRLGDAPESDEELTQYLEEATDMVEEVTWVSPLDSTYDVTYDSTQMLGRHECGVVLPRWPVLEGGVTTFQYRDSADTWQIMPAENYELEHLRKPAVIRLKGNPPELGSGMPIYKITFKAGWDDTSDVPAGFKAAIMMAAEGAMDGCECPQNQIGMGGPTDKALKAYEVPRSGADTRRLTKPSDRYVA